MIFFAATLLIFSGKPNIDNDNDLSWNVLIIIILNRAPTDVNAKDRKENKKRKIVPKRELQSVLHTESMKTGVCIMGRKYWVWEMIGDKCREGWGGIHFRPLLIDCGEGQARHPSPSSQDQATKQKKKFQIILSLWKKEEKACKEDRDLWTMKEVRQIGHSLLHFRRNFASSSTFPDREKSIEFRSIDHLTFFFK